MAQILSLQRNAWPSRHLGKAVEGSPASRINVVVVLLDRDTGPGPVRLECPGAKCLGLMELSCTAYKGNKLVASGDPFASLAVAIAWGYGG